MNLGIIMLEPHVRKIFGQLVFRDYPNEFYQSTLQEILWVISKLFTVILLLNLGLAKSRRNPSAPMSVQIYIKIAQCHCQSLSKPGGLRFQQVL
jgi:hypothetical protein